VPVLRAQGKPREEKRNDVGRSMTLNSVFFCKLKNPLHATRSRVDSLETVHWHNCRLYHRMPTDGLQSTQVGARKILAVAQTPREWRCDCGVQLWPDEKFPGMTKTGEGVLTPVYKICARRAWTANRSDPGSTGVGAAGR
jgi:hypothetical protein